MRQITQYYRHALPPTCLTTKVSCSVASHFCLAFASPTIHQKFLNGYVDTADGRASSSMGRLVAELQPRASPATSCPPEPELLGTKEVNVYGGVANLTGLRLQALKVSPTEAQQCAPSRCSGLTAHALLAVLLSMCSNGATGPKG